MWSIEHVAHNMHVYMRLRMLPIGHCNVHASAYAPTVTHFLEYSSPTRVFVVLADLHGSISASRSTYIH